MKSLKNKKRVGLTIRLNACIRWNRIKENVLEQQVACGTFTRAHVCSIGGQLKKRDRDRYQNSRNASSKIMLRIIQHFLRQHIRLNKKCSGFMLFSDRVPNCLACQSSHAYANSVITVCQLSEPG